MRVAQPPCGTPLNKAHSLCQGLVGSWPMNEGGGLKAFDNIGNKTGILTSGAVFRYGVKGRSIFSDGTDDYIDTGTPFNNVFAGANVKFSISLWVKPGTALTGNNLFLNFNISTGQRTFTLRLFTSSKVEFLWYGALDGSSVRGTLGTTPISSTTSFYHIVATYDGTLGVDSRVSIYVNGIQDATTIDVTSGTPPAGIQNSTQNLCFAANPSGGNAFQGLMNNVMLYNRLLSASDVRQLYTNPYCMYVGKIK